MHAAKIESHIQTAAYPRLIRKLAHVPIIRKNSFGLCPGRSIGSVFAVRLRAKNRQQPSTAAAPGAYTKQEIEAEFIEALQEKLIGNSKISLTLFGAFIKNTPMWPQAILSSGNFPWPTAFTRRRFPLTKGPWNWNRRTNGTWWALAELYDFLKMYKESKDVYKKLSELYPTELELRFSAVSILVQEGKLLRKPSACWIKIEVNRTPFEGVTAEINMEKYRLYMAQKKVHTERLGRNWPSLHAHVPARNLVLGHVGGGILCQMGDKKEALEAYEKILATDSNNTIIHSAVADFYQKEKNLDKAFYHLEKASVNLEVAIRPKK